MCAAACIARAVVKCKPDNFSASSPLPPQGGKRGRPTAGTNTPIPDEFGHMARYHRNQPRHSPGEPEQDVEMYGATGSSATSDSRGVAECWASSREGGAVWYTRTRSSVCGIYSTECEIHWFLGPLLLALMSALPLSFSSFFF